MIWVTWVYPYMIKTKYCAHVNVCINKKHTYLYMTCLQQNTTRRWHDPKNPLQPNGVYTSAKPHWKTPLVSSIIISPCWRRAMPSWPGSNCGWRTLQSSHRKKCVHLEYVNWLLMFIVLWTNYFLNLQHLDVSIQFATYRSWVCLWCKLKFTNSRYARGTLAA